MVCENNNIYYLTISVDQEFGCGSLGCFWHGVYHEVTVKMLVELLSLQESTGAGGFTSKISHWKVKASILRHVVPLYRRFACSHSMSIVSGFPHSE